MISLRARALRVSPRRAVIRHSAGQSGGPGGGLATVPKLTAIAIKNAPDGKYQDGDGLIFIRSGERGKWVLRYTHLGRRREMGLGPWPAVTLAEARKTADHWRRQLRAGLDPIALRDSERLAERVRLDQSDPTFAEAVDIVLAARQARLRGGGTRGRWRSPLDLYVVPAIGRRRLSTLHQSDIVAAIKPIWRAKHPTATKAIGRTRIVLRTARLMGYPADDGIVDMAQVILGEVLHKATPIEATPWQDAPALFAALLARGSVAGDCAAWHMLTAMRSDACRGARHDEIAGDVWTVPADRIKGSAGKVRALRVPLSPAAVAIATRARDYPGPYLFPGSTGRPITDAAIGKLLGKLGEAGRLHGFRTTFRTWTQDTESCSDRVAEMILGHSVMGAVEAAYARSDMLDQRRTALDAWGGYLAGG